MKVQIVRWMAAIGLAAVAMTTGPAVAQDQADRECVGLCREATHDCRFDAREAGRACLEEAGCDTLRDDYRVACLSEESDRDSEACAEARTALRECIAPCRDARRDAAGTCREEMVTCLADECGIEAPSRPRRHRGRPHRR